MQNIKNTLSEIPDRISGLSELTYNSCWSWYLETQAKQILDIV